MTLSLRRLAAASETRCNLPHHQGKEDEDAPEDLQRHQPVPRKPVAEDSGEDRLHRKDYRRPGGGDVQHRRGDGRGDGLDELRLPFTTPQW